MHGLAMDFLQAMLKRELFRTKEHNMRVRDKMTTMHANQVTKMYSAGGASGHSGRLLSYQTNGSQNGFAP
jgi:hypothetical protein